MDGPFPVLWKGGGLLAVDKPAGVPVVPARHGDPQACVRRILEAALGRRLWVVHRLDRDTSGVLLLALDPEAHRVASLAFQRRQIRKWYLAFTRGLPKCPNGSIEVPLHRARKGKMRPAARGEHGALAARTDYEVIRRWELPGGGEVGLVEAQPLTGRLHQVRVHLRFVGAPLLVDPTYGGASRITAADLGLEGDEVLAGRLTLHAARLQLLVPGTRELVAIGSPLPNDLARLAARLDEAASAARPSRPRPPANVRPSRP